MLVKTVRTSELSGFALDWAVAVSLDERARFATGSFRPSTNWAQGGPIIDRERICTLDTGDAAKWKAYRWQNDNFTPEQYGSTPLIAAMRCFVASKLGDTVDIPEELINA